MSSELRNSLWNVLDMRVWNQEGFTWHRYGSPGIDKFTERLWSDYFKLPIDTRPKDSSAKLAFIRKYFFSCSWNEVYDFLEWVLRLDVAKQSLAGVNHVLETELAGYRYIGGQFTTITSEEEVALLQEAVDDPEFPGVREHLRSALSLMSRREDPDYRNSIKESISAVEAMARHISGVPKATLGDALSVLERKGVLHGALKNGFSSLYGYASDDDGIRHAMLAAPTLTADDAKYFLLSCSSFVGYLKAKA